MITHINHLPRSNRVRRNNKQWVKMIKCQSNRTVKFLSGRHKAKCSEMPWRLLKMMMVDQVVVVAVAIQRLLINMTIELNVNGAVGNLMIQQHKGTYLNANKNIKLIKWKARVDHLQVKVEHRNKEPLLLVSGKDENSDK